MQLPHVQCTIFGRVSIIPFDGTCRSVTQNFPIAKVAIREGCYVTIIIPVRCRSLGLGMVPWGRRTMSWEGQIPAITSEERSHRDYVHGRILAILRPFSNMIAEELRLFLLFGLFVYFLGLKTQLDIVGLKCLSIKNRYDLKCRVT